MKQKYDLVCIGDVVIDAFIGLKEAKIEWDKKHKHPELEMAFADKIPYESLMVMPAVGNSSNVAVGARRLGLDTAIITAIGDDRYGGDRRKSGTRRTFLHATELGFINPASGEEVNFTSPLPAELADVLKRFS